MRYCICISLTLGRQRPSINPTYAALPSYLWVDGSRFSPSSVHTLSYGHTYSKSMDQPGKVASPARGQLNMENEYFPVRVRV